MPKKPPCNPYYFFMLDYKSREERLGRKFPGGLKDVAIAAGEEWKRVSPRKKEYYTRKAKEKKSNSQPKPNVPPPKPPVKPKSLNYQGIRVTGQLEKEKVENEEMLFQINRFVENFVNGMDLGKLSNKILYLIHVNYFCKTEDDVYYPAELAIVKFNLKHGVRSIFHRYIDPGEIAAGYSFVIKEHGDMTHKIPLSFVKSIDNANNLARMYNDICEFLLQSETSGTIPPLFTMYDDISHNTNMTAVKKTLQQLWESAFCHYEDDGSYEHLFKVYPLPLLLWRLKNKCSRREAFPNSAMAMAELKKDTYSFDVKTACNFHQTEDVIAMCSRSYVLRWAFIIRDHCCRFLGIDTDGDHENFETKMFKTGDFAFSENNDNCAGSAGFSSANQGIKNENDFDYGNQNIKKEKDYDTLNIGKEEDNCTCGSRNIKKEKEDCGSQRIRKEKDCDTLNIGKEDDCTCGNRNIKKEKVDCDSQNIKKEKEDCGSENIKKEKIDDSGVPKIKEENVFDPVFVKIKEEKIFDYESETSQSTESCSVASPSQSRETKNVRTLIDDDFPASGFGNDKRIKLEVKEEKIDSPTEYH